MFDNFVIAGIPLLLVVLGLVEAMKMFGLSGKILTAISLAVGIGLCIAYQIGTAGVPAGFMPWLEVCVTGLMFGLAASGIYDLTKQFRS